MDAYVLTLCAALSDSSVNRTAESRVHLPACWDLLEQCIHAFLVLGNGDLLRHVGALISSKDELKGVLCREDRIAFSILLDERAGRERGARFWW